MTGRENVDIDYKRILALKVNAKKCPDFDDDTLNFIVLQEFASTAERLYGQGWKPMDIRDHVAEMNAALLEDALPREDVDAAVTERLEEMQGRVRKECDSPGEHIVRLRKEVQSWGDSYAFTLGIQPLDNAWGGLMPGELGVLVGSQGSMKTSLALNGVEHFLRENPKATVLFFSLDMTAEELSARLIMRDLGVSLQEMYGMMREKSQQYLDAEQRFGQATKGRLKILGNGYQKRWTIEGFEYQVALRNPDLVMVDFLTCLKRPGQSDLEAVEDIMPRVQGITQKMRIKTLLLSQMGRASKSDQAKGVIGGHSKGGGIVEELAHAEIELFKDAPAEEGEKPRIVATVTKTRRGVNGASFQLDYKGKQMEFTGQARRVQKDKDRKPIFQSMSGI